MNKARKRNKSLSIGVCILILVFMAIVGHSCEPGLAVSEYEKNVRAALRRLYHSITSKGLDWDEIVRKHRPPAEGEGA